MPIPNFRNRSWALALRLLRSCPMVLEVVDARDVAATRVPRLERMAGRKLVLVAAKSDLLPGSPRGLCVQPNGLTIFYISSRTHGGVEELKKWILDKSEIRFARYGRPRMVHGELMRTFDILIYGIPNVGKSSLINAIRGRHVSATGFRAGITRGVQIINLAEGVRLIDMPGVVDWSIGEEHLALHAALDVEKLKDPLSVAERLIEQFISKKDDGLANHFGVRMEGDAETLLASIARKRGRLGKGGEPDVEEAAKIVLREWQKGKYGLSKVQGLSAAKPPPVKAKPSG